MLKQLQRTTNTQNEKPYTYTVYTHKPIFPALNIFFVIAKIILANAVISSNRYLSQNHSVSNKRTHFDPANSLRENLIYAHYKYLLSVSTPARREMKISHLFKFDLNFSRARSSCMVKYSRLRNHERWN